MNIPTINPEWTDAPYQLAILDRQGRQLGIIDPLRFKEGDRAAVFKAMHEHDSDTLNRLAVRKWIWYEA